MCCDGNKKAEIKNTENKGNGENQKRLFGTEYVFILVSDKTSSEIRI